MLWPVSDRATPALSTDPTLASVQDTALSRQRHGFESKISPKM
jgi:hypothetical protein